ncbi:hypothetical protein [Candidatus Palauibacter soopunensis]|uniref:hypothetical protein n=1 Tax=Candidatus Palauibacter soopunensis TaxID=3056739 RepID=UPI00238B15B9|nr:hypothetical protein [Candidatus Palauibacter soopunensis]MDE2879214.1 hypothetical protein [Candidatus Palauibacter soopunensis]
MMRCAHLLRPLVFVAAVSAVAAPAPAAAQDANFLLPIPEIERVLREGEIQVLDVQPSRGLPGERTYRVTLQSGDHVLGVKYAPAREGADEFNNRPRYELAAYEVQTLFLDEREMVVPPTAIRAFPLDVVQATLARAGDAANPPERTFDEWPMTLVALQYWMFNVDLPEELPDEDRIEADEVYERLLGNFNLLTYAIGHSDSNQGNFMQSMDPDWPRVFSVDNGVAFASEESNRGTQWRDLQLDRYPASAIDRLRGLSLEGLQAQFGVLVQLEIRDGNFVEVEPTENLDPGRGVRRDAERIQLGLTEREIRAMHRRIVRLLERVDDGRYGLIP